MKLIENILLITVLLEVSKSQEEEHYIPPPVSSVSSLFDDFLTGRRIENGKLTVSVGNQNSADVNVNPNDLKNSNVNGNNNGETDNTLAVSQSDVDSNGKASQGIPEERFPEKDLIDNGNESPIKPEIDSIINIIRTENGDTNVQRNLDGIEIDNKYRVPSDLSSISFNNDTPFTEHSSNKTETESNVNNNSITIISGNGILSNGISISTENISIVNGNNDDANLINENENIKNVQSNGKVRAHSGSEVISIAVSGLTSTADAGVQGKSDNDDSIARSGIESLFRAIAGGGIPGDDYPVLTYVPKTSFSCPEGYRLGYYADIHPSSKCQVFHICQEDGRLDSFLCPIGTLFNQKYLVCDWWYNVDCSSSVGFYFLNDLIGRSDSNVESAANDLDSKSSFTSVDNHIDVAEDFGSDLSDPANDVGVEIIPEVEQTVNDSEIGEKTVNDRVEGRETGDDNLLNGVRSNVEVGANLNKQDQANIENNHFQLKEIAEDSKNTDIPTELIDSETGDDQSLSAAPDVPRSGIQEETLKGISDKEALQYVEVKGKTTGDSTNSISHDGNDQVEENLSNVVETHDLANGNINEYAERRIGDGHEKESPLNIEADKLLITTNKGTPISNTRENINTNSQQTSKYTYPQTGTGTGSTRPLNSYGVSTHELRNKKGFRE